ncbi:hypothetical protein BJF83_14095 [Nocardiopsis sp. CNR-923]|uniref:hypothetical protein n=1 Tax=Nocardiopsis sp. CNR-923 TaxID=1904965 RepID=UPI00095DFAB6|nr:hypothetical protein [Nocardiopsis sp. CNR-923]OLT28812.1 hypothetical protein BJF83_14095 [Nocardiopsis sp. CNR-923]
MTKSTWSLAIPDDGLALKELVFVGGGKDLEVRLRRDDGPVLVLGVSSSRVNTAGEVALDITSLGDVSLALSYSGPGLILTALDIGWDDDDEWNTELPIGLEALFAAVGTPDGKRVELNYCVDVEASLTTRAA